jgi:hypothetical protein
MALFRRKKSDDSTALPEEVNSYYQAENRERTWMAWLLAIVTLAVTAIIIIGLFFGGRWVYRKVRNNPSTPTAVVTEKPEEQNKPNTPEPTTSTPETATPTPSTGSVNAPTNPSPTSSSTNSTPGSSATSSPVAAATTGIPNTGPGDMLGVFFAVSLLAYILHRRFQNQ